MSADYYMALELFKQLVACYNNLPIEKINQEVQDDIQKVIEINEDISVPTTCNLFKCKELLAQLKLLIIRFSANDPLVPIRTKNINELLLTREILERGVIISIRDKDVKSFSIYFDQLFIFYFDYTNILPKSKKQNGIIGVYLLYLLATNAISDFHMLLEILPIEDLQDKYIKYVLELEQHIMDGYFHFVLTKKEQIPLYLYSLFIDKFHDTIRTKLADCISASSTCISVDHARELMHFENVNELNEFINMYNEAQNAQGENAAIWEVKNDMIYFKNQVVNTPEIPALEMFNNAIGYATELERIV